MLSDPSTSSTHVCFNVHLHNQCCFHITAARLKAFIVLWLGARCRCGRRRGCCSVRCAPSSTRCHTLRSRPSPWSRTSPCAGGCDRRCVTLSCVTCARVDGAQACMRVLHVLHAVRGCSHLACLVRYAAVWGRPSPAAPKAVYCMQPWAWSIVQPQGGTLAPRPHSPHAPIACTHAPLSLVSTPRRLSRSALPQLLYAFSANFSLLPAA